VLRTAEEIETTQENMKNWLEMDEGDPELQCLVFLQVLNESSTVIIFYLFSSALTASVV
jgi:hypothetical protein